MMHQSIPQLLHHQSQEPQIMLGTDVPLRRPVPLRVRFKGALTRSHSSILPTTESTKSPCSEDGISRISIKDRLQYFTWNWFTAVMATGGITDVIHSIPYSFRGLETIGKCFLVFNILQFLVTCTLITIRFTTHRGSFKKSFLDPSESLFVPASVVSVGILLMNIAQYGIPATGRWLRMTFEGLFWLYAILAFLCSCATYLILWSTQEFSLPHMTPLWVFPVYPLLIVAPLAASLINSIPTPHETLRISSQTILGGAIALQGIGFLVSVLIYSAFIYRLMMHGLPSIKSLPSMFISVGPAGFTCTGVIQFGALAWKAIPFNNSVANSYTVAVVVKVLAYTIGLCIWGWAIWFFALSIGGQWKAFSNKKTRIPFDVSFYAYVFPNSALVSATHAVAEVFSCFPLKVIGTVLAGLLVLAWIVVFLKSLWAVWTRKLLWIPMVSE